MSGKSGASGSMRSCAGSVRLATSAGHELVLDAFYERKRDNKSVRVLTVIIYVFCVSLAAIMLSLYYVFFWEPKDAPYADRKVLHTVEKHTTTMPTCLMPHTGGGDSGVSSVPLNLTDIYNATVAPSVITPSTVAPSAMTLSTLDDSELNATEGFNHTDNIT